MSQELSDLLTISGAVVLSLSAIPYTSWAISYRDTKRYFSLTDETRQQALGKLSYLKILKDDLKGFLTTVTTLGMVEPDHNYSMKYWSAYLESMKEKEENKYLGYRKLKEE